MTNEGCQSSLTLTVSLISMRVAVQSAEARPADLSLRSEGIGENR